MEIVKQNESFLLKDTNGLLVMSGGATREVSGSLNVHFSVSKGEGERVGDCYYNKYGENGEVNFSVNCPEENRDELATYADSVVDSVLEFFKSAK